MTKPGPISSNEILASLYHPLWNEKPATEKTLGCQNAYWKCPENVSHVWMADPQHIRRWPRCPFCNGRDPISYKPELAAQYHPLWNQEPVTVKTLGSGTAYWKCPMEVNHVWVAAPGNRDKNPSCPFCTKPAKYAGMENSLLVKSPKLVGYVHPTLNRNRQGHIIDASSILPKANKLFWKCAMAPDHVWSNSVEHMLDGRTSLCPFCKDSHAEVSITNAITTTHPDLANQIHPRNDVVAHRLSTSHASTIVRWKCTIGPDHEWYCSLEDRFNTSNSTGVTSCPCCSNPQKQVSVTRNAANDRELRARLEPTMNHGQLLHRESPHSGKRFVWKCPANPNHVWGGAIANSYQRDEGGESRLSQCPFCYGRYATLENNLAILNRRINHEWDHEKNLLNGRTLTNTSPGSDYPAHWVCNIPNCGHEWTASVDQRSGMRETSRPTGCPNCAKAYNRSRIEVRIIHEICHASGLEYSDDYRFIDDRGQKSVDFISEIVPLIIEVDGGFRHSTEEQIERDRRWSERMSKDYHLLRIRDSRLEDIVIHEHEIHARLDTQDHLLRERIVIPALIHIRDETELPPEIRDSICNYIQADDTEMVTLTDADAHYNHLLELAHTRRLGNQE